jgi:hypothetical protein
MTRTSQRWQTLPGSFDTVHARQIFPSDNAFGIPALAHTPVSRVPRWLAPYRARIRTKQGAADGAVHFFLDDYRFETVWSRPRKALEALRPFRTLLTPDFSLYSDWPRALQVWNTYRSRWCGAFWQSLGFTVIPSISWSTQESYDFCFAGVPQHNLVALSTLGVNLRIPIQRQRFLDGFQAMIERLQPSRVLCYGRPPVQATGMADVVRYPTRWEGIVKARRRTHGW